MLQYLVHEIEFKVELIIDYYWHQMLHNPTMEPSEVIKWVCQPIYTHTNPWGRLKWPYAIASLIAHFMCGLMSDLVICKFRKSMVMYDTKCPYWDQVSLINTKPNPLWRFCSSWDATFHAIVHDTAHYPWDAIAHTLVSRALAVGCFSYGVWCPYTAQNKPLSTR